MIAKFFATVALLVGIGLFSFGIFVTPSHFPIPTGPDGREPSRNYDIRVIVWALPGMVLARIGAKKLLEYCIT